MTIDELLKDKAIKPKEKTEAISKWILDKSLPVDELIAFADKQHSKRRSNVERNQRNQAVCQYFMDGFHGFIAPKLLCSH